MLTIEETKKIGRALRESDHAADFVVRETAPRGFTVWELFHAESNQVFVVQLDHAGAELEVFDPWNDAELVRASDGSALGFEGCEVYAVYLAAAGMLDWLTAPYRVAGEYRSDLRACDNADQLQLFKRVA